MPHVPMMPRETVLPKKGERMRATRGKLGGWSDAWCAIAVGVLCLAAAGPRVEAAAWAGDSVTAPPPGIVPDGDAGDVCLEALRDVCCPDWRRYAVFDVLFLQRNNQTGDRILVSDADTGLPAITSRDLQPALATGVRAFYGSLVTDDLGWEIGYLGVYGMFGEAEATGPDTLEMAPPLGLAVNNFQNAESARATYWSTLNMAEVNLFAYDCCQECGPAGCGLTNGRPSCHCIDWIAGFVWAGLDEQASLSMACCSPPEPASYTVRAATGYFGPQLGMRGRRQWQRWGVEGWWKTALCGTSASQSADPIVGTISGQERPAESASAIGVGFIGNLNATLVYRLTDAWGLRAGYNLIWLTNAALAPTQWDFDTAEGAGADINDNGGIFLHGANLGLEARW